MWIGSLSAEFGVTPLLCAIEFVADSEGVASGAASAAPEEIKIDAATAVVAARLVKIRRFMTSPNVRVLGSVENIAQPDSAPVGHPKGLKGKTKETVKTRSP